MKPGSTSPPVKMSRSLNSCDVSGAVNTSSRGSLARCRPGASARRRCRAPRRRKMSSRSKRRKTACVNLVDGVLVEKTVGYRESYLACELVRELGKLRETPQVGHCDGRGGHDAVSASVSSLGGLSTWAMRDSRRARFSLFSAAAGLAPRALAAGGSGRCERGQYATGVITRRSVAKRQKIYAFRRSPGRYSVKIEKGNRQ